MYLSAFGAESLSDHHCLGRLEKPDPDPLGPPIYEPQEPEFVRRGG
jgi:hypothetical protein